MTYGCRMSYRGSGSRNGRRMADMRLLFALRNLLHMLRFLGLLVTANFGTLVGEVEVTPIP